MGKKIKITEEQLKRLIVLKEGWGGYDTSSFVENYREELENAVKKLHKVTPEMYRNLSPEDNQRVTKELSHYDDNVYDYIMNWVETGDCSIDDIADLAIENEEEWGTEPQFVIYAIDDFCEIFGITDSDVEDEGEDEEEEDLPTPPSEEETKNNQVYESIRASFKRFL